MIFAGLGHDLSRSLRAKQQVWEYLKVRYRFLSFSFASTENKYSLTKALLWVCGFSCHFRGPWTQSCNPMQPIPLSNLSLTSNSCLLPIHTLLSTHSVTWTCWLTSSVHGKVTELLIYSYWREIKYKTTSNEQSIRNNHCCKQTVTTRQKLRDNELQTNTAYLAI